MDELTEEEARALLKVIDEADYVGLQEFARLDEAENVAIWTAITKLKRIADRPCDDHHP